MRKSSTWIKSCSDQAELLSIMNERQEYLYYDFYCLYYLQVNYNFYFDHFYFFFIILKYIFKILITFGFVRLLHNKNSVLKQIMISFIIYLYFFLLFFYTFAIIIIAIAVISVMNSIITTCSSANI